MIPLFTSRIMEFDMKLFEPLRLRGRTVSVLVDLKPVSRSKVMGLFENFHRN